ncbi:MAG TPA: hypothetical protein PK228_01495 [Saprospiraceae bacterium]|nr:hypothetical protein [Saprospiraceae bacterium]
MSATKHTHHDRIEAAQRSDYNPRTIDDLRAEALRLHKRLMELQTEYAETIICYINDLRHNRLISDIRREVDEINDKLDLLLAEYMDRRRI